MRCAVTHYLARYYPDPEPEYLTCPECEGHHDDDCETCHGTGEVEA